MVKSSAASSCSSTGKVAFNDTEITESPVITTSCGIYSVFDSTSKVGRAEAYKHEACKLGSRGGKQDDEVVAAGKSRTAKNDIRIRPRRKRG